MYRASLSHLLLLASTLTVVAGSARAQEASEPPRAADAPTADVPPPAPSEPAPPAAPAAPTDEVPAPSAPPQVTEAPATAAQPSPNDTPRANLGPPLAEATAPGFETGPQGETTIEPVSRRVVALGAIAGTTYRSTRGDSAIEYGWGTVYGAQAALKGEDYLTLILTFTGGRQPVELPPGSLGPTAETRLEQSKLKLNSFQLLAAPTYPWRDAHLALAVGGGVSWNFVVAGSPSSPSDAPESYYSARRTGSFYEAQGFVELDWQPIPRWLELSGRTMLMLPFAFKGTAFDSDVHVQAFDQKDTTKGIEHLSALPGFGVGGSFVLALSLLL